MAMVAACHNFSACSGRIEIGMEIPVAVKDKFCSKFRFASVSF